MPTTSRLALPYPASTAPADVPADIQSLATALDVAAIHSQGLYSARPAAGIQGRLYTATDRGGTVYMDTGSGWVQLHSQHYVTSLPASPANGDVIFFGADPSNGVIWQLRYRDGAPGSYKWEFVGGPPLYSYGGVATHTTANITNYTLMSPNPSLTVPLAGEYVATLVGDAYRNGTFAARIGLSTDGSTLHSSGTGMNPIWIDSSAASHLWPVFLSVKPTLAASANLRVILSTNGVSVNFGHSTGNHLRLLPVRVG